MTTTTTATNNDNLWLVPVTEARPDGYRVHRIVIRSVSAKAAARRAKNEFTYTYRVDANGNPWKALDPRTITEQLAAGMQRRTLYPEVGEPTKWDGRARLTPTAARGIYQF